MKSHNDNASVYSLFNTTLQWLADTATPLLIQSNIIIVHLDH